MFGVHLYWHKWTVNSLEVDFLLVGLVNKHFNSTLSMFVHTVILLQTLMARVTSAEPGLITTEVHGQPLYGNLQLHA